MYYLCSTIINQLTLTNMITKGTADYKRAQDLANELQTVAAYQRWNNNSMFKLFFDPFYRLINEVKDLGVFASQVAETIDSKCNPYGYKIANLSSKQAWILACAAIENNVDCSGIC